jgi:radical SAM protein with 4Fe4S-binding SPASM domain
MILKDSDIIAEKITKEIKPFLVVLTGGEPLMNFDTTFNLMKKFSKENINYTLNSNITLLNENKLDKILEVKPKIDILTSLPSFIEETYTKITGKNTIKKFYENLGRGIKKGAKIIPNMVTHELNQHQVYEEGKFLFENYGITRFCATPMVRPSKRKESYYNGATGLIKTLEDLIKLRENLGIKVSTLEVIPKCALPEELRSDKLVNNMCSAGRSSFMIGYNGDVRACGHSPFSEGNLINEEFDNLWKKFEKYRENKYIPEECNECLEILNCRGGCMYEGFRENDKLGKKDSRMKEPLKKPIKKESIEIKENVPYFLTNYKIRQENTGQYTIYNGNSLFINEGVKELLEGIKEKGYIKLNEIPKQYRNKASNLSKILLNGGFLKKA